MVTVWSLLRCVKFIILYRLTVRYYAIHLKGSLAVEYSQFTFWAFNAVYVFEHKWFLPTFEKFEIKMRFKLCKISSDLFKCTPIISASIYSRSKVYLLQKLHWNTTA